MPPAKKPAAKTPTGAAAKLAYIQQRVQNVDKTGEVSFGKTRYKHMQEHGLLEVLKPLIREVNAAIVLDVVDSHREGNHSFIDARITLIDPELSADDVNYAVSARYPNEAIDSSDKASNKALTNANKYALQKFFQVPTEAIEDIEGYNEESTAAAHKKASSAQVQAVREQLKTALDQGTVNENTTKAKLQSDYAVDRIDQLTTQQLNGFRDWLANV